MSFDVSSNVRKKIWTRNQQPSSNNDPSTHFDAIVCWHLCGDSSCHEWMRACWSMTLLIGISFGIWIEKLLESKPMWLTVRARSSQIIFAPEGGELFDVYSDWVMRNRAYLSFVRNIEQTLTITQRVASYADERVWGSSRRGQPLPVLLWSTLLIQSQVIDIVTLLSPSPKWFRFD